MGISELRRAMRNGGKEKFETCQVCNVGDV